jgi:hypothetical protein
VVLPGRAHPLDATATQTDLDGDGDGDGDGTVTFYRVPLRM